MECHLPLWAEGDVQGWGTKHLCAVARYTTLQTLVARFLGASWEERCPGGAGKKLLQAALRKEKEERMGQKKPEEEWHMVQNVD